MIIKHVPDAKTPVTDTDKLPDVEAMIMEQAEALRQLCFNACRQMILVVDAKGEGTGNGCQFWNLKMPEMEGVVDGEKISNNTEDRNKAYQNIFTMAHQFVMNLSQGKIGVVNLENYNAMIKTLAAYHAEIERLKEKLGTEGDGRLPEDSE